jgi:hypothetical protein
MRPKTNSSTPHTISDVVDEPVEGIVPVELLVGLPPLFALELPPPVTGVDAPTTTNVVVR